jgi:hypothetical protein
MEVSTIHWNISKTTVTRVGYRSANVAVNVAQQLLPRRGFQNGSFSEFLIMGGIFKFLEICTVATVVFPGFHSSFMPPVCALLYLFFAFS